MLAKLAFGPFSKATKAENVKIPNVSDNGVHGEELDARAKA